MKTVILTIPEAKENWFRTLFSQFKVKHKVLSGQEREDLILAKLIDEAMEEKGEISRDKIDNFIKKYGS